MTDRADPAPAFVRLLPATVGVLTAALLLLVAGVALGRHHGTVQGTTRLVDFDIFLLAGRMAWDGTLAQAYRTEVFYPLQESLSGAPGTMPYSYPPPFGLIAAVLGTTENWLAYAGFVAGTLTAFLLALRRLAGESFGAILVLLLPVLAIGVLTGQNGFLTGAIVALFAGRAVSGRGGAGAVLGLLVLKPHLGLGLGLHAVLSRRWDWIAQAAAVALGASLLATLAFGPAIWPAFLIGAAQSREILEAGDFPLFRMASAYATLRSLGLPPGLALGLHGALAAGGAVALALALRAGWAMRRSLALATLVTLLASPYLYDYDLTLMAVALALAAPDLARVRGSFAALLSLLWFAGLHAYGTGWLVYRRFLAGERLTLDDRPIALAAPALLAALALVAVALAAGERRRREADAATRA